VTATSPERRGVVALCGGIGGAKLALGLYRTCDPEDLTIIVNTGDDFEHLGLHISPDLDTVLYTLSGLADRERGWGRGDETWNFMAALGALGGETWFNLGDRDLALHVARTEWLRSGGTLSAFIDRTAKQLGIGATILPMSDDPVRTIVDTNEGELPFQHYFVKRRCEPVLRSVRFAHVETAVAAPVRERFRRFPPPPAIVFCPSNPWLSIDPILAVPGMKEWLNSAGCPVVAISPLVGGKAVKGPTGKIMAELGISPTPAAIAKHYQGLIHGLIIDRSDPPEGLDLPFRATETLMQTLADRDRLAQEALDFAAELARP
jgi:LPPG:FO 2-phospho-L-lactate transferase